MYKVLLVDDEDLIREAISKKLNWESMGYTLEGLCKNGKEAIEFIDKNPIDLLITDICMPYVDGLELSKYVYEEHPDVKIIILSGYNDFDYAKNAMKYRVLEYILKPVTFSELSEILINLKENFKEEEVKQASMDKLKDEYKKNIPILRVRYLNQLVQGQQKESEEEELRKRLKAFDINIYGNYYKVAVVEEEAEEFISNNNGLKADLPAFIIYNIIEEIVRTKNIGLTFQNLYNKTVIIFIGANKGELDHRIEETFEEAKNILKGYYEINIAFGLGKVVENLCNLKISYQGGESVLEYRFLFGSDVLLDIRNFSKGKQDNEVDFSASISKLVLAIKINAESDIKNFLGEIMDKLREERMSRNRIYIYVQNIIVAIGNLMENAGLGDDSEIKGQEHIMHELYEEKTLQDLEKKLYKLCSRTGRILAEQRNSFSTRQAVLALDYIDKNYSREDLSLQIICSDLAISPSYFSSIFKSYTGETFIEALTKKRIGKAKDLLGNTTLKNYEIAEKVGFSDPHYFAITFKKITGMTPKEYAKESR